MFSVYWKDRVCGKAEVKEHGLYCRIYCKCDMPTQQPCKILLQTEGKCIDLGTCIRVGSKYVIDTKIPLKNIDPKTMQFTMCLKAAKAAGGFVPVEDDRPFPFIHKLEKGRMVLQNGQVGVVFTD